MNQHQIQKAYLKNFTSNNLLWVYEKDKSTKPYKKPTNSLTIEEDFQSTEKENEQNRLIETPGIRRIKELIHGTSKLDSVDFDILLQWIALHSIRNANSRNINFDSKKQYERDFNNKLSTECKYLNKIEYCDTYTTSNDQFFITSDNPVLEIEISGLYCFILPLSPSIAILLSSHGRRPNHSTLSFPDSVNTMIYGNCVNEVYSDRDNLPIERLRLNCKKWNMAPAAETIVFKE